MKSRISIRRKISSLTFKIALISIIVIGLITVSGLLILRSAMSRTSGQSGDASANESQQALEETTIDRLITLAANRAALGDMSLEAVQNSVKMIASHAEEIIQNPDEYKPKPVLPPDAKNKGIMTAQFMKSENADIEEIGPGAALMGNIQSLLLNIIENNVHATSDYVGSEQGYTIIVDENSESKAEFFDSRERPWYRLAKENNALSWTDIYLDAYGRRLSITCAMPYYDKDGLFFGVAGVGMTLTDLTKIVIGSKIGETGYAFMLNEKGEIIISDDLKTDANGNLVRTNLLESDNVELSQAAAEMIEGQKGIYRITIEGKEYFYAYAALDTLPWTLVTVMDVDEAIAPALETKAHIIEMTDKAISNINVVIIAMFAAFVVVIVVVILLIGYTSQKFSDTLTKPILLLQDGVSQIASGNLSHTIDIQTGDEIESLGLSVNKMALDIKDYIANLQTVTAEKERIGAELDVATKIQSSMLPCIFPPFPNRTEFDIYASMQPAKEVGGDFYDFFLLDDNTLAVVIADVSGKGVPAALFMVIAKTLIKNNAQYGKSPKEVFETVDNLLCENNDAGMFVTAFMGYLDIPNGKFVFVNAGHNPPLLRSGDKFDWLRAKPGFVLGGMEDMFYKQYEVSLSPGDEIFLYTDGVTEAADMGNRLFGNTRLLEAVNSYPHLPLKEFTETLKREIDMFAGGAEQADDITMLALRYKGENTI